jgi:hypothetical protein
MQHILKSPELLNRKDSMEFVSDETSNNTINLWFTKVGFRLFYGFFHTWQLPSGYTVNIRATYTISVVISDARFL